MRIYCKTTLPIHQSVKTAFANKKIDGVTIVTSAANFFSMHGGFNNSLITTLRNEVKKNSLPFLLATIWGNNCGNYIYNNFPYLRFVRRHHAGVGDELSINIPVFYHEQAVGKKIILPFLEKVKEISTAISDELRRDTVTYSFLQGAYVTGGNETTEEMRDSSTDFEGLLPTEQFEAFYDCAMKWIAAQYTPNKSIFFNCELIKTFKAIYSDVPIIMQYILGVNGHPCVDNNGQFVKPKLRANTTLDILNFGQTLTPNFKPSMTYFNSTTVTTDRIVEVQRDYFSLKSTADADFEKMVEHAEETGIELLQCHLENINKYRIFK